MSERSIQLTDREVADVLERASKCTQEALELAARAAARVAELELTNAALVVVLASIPRTEKGARA